MKTNWQIKKLGEVCDVYQPKTISAKQMVANGEYVVFGANDQDFVEYNGLRIDKQEVCSRSDSMFRLIVSQVPLD